jgi:predicted amidohydrolase
MSRFHLVQADLAWEDATTNRAMLADMTRDCTDGVVVLPEMFSTGFSMASAQLAEPMSGPTVAWLQTEAEQHQRPLCGSVIARDKGQYFNRFIWAAPGSEPTWYDKRHLFRMAGEDAHYAPGNTRVVVQHNGLSILPQVCYDLRFPVWSRNRGDYDVMVVVANWPAARREQWLALLRARAIENLCYVVAVNRVGTDGNDVVYSGDSCVIDYLGNTLLDLGTGTTVATAEIDLESLRAWRTQFPAHLDADDFRVLTQTDS